MRFHKRLVQDSDLHDPSPFQLFSRFFYPGVLFKIHYLGLGQWGSNPVTNIPYKYSEYKWSVKLLLPSPFLGHTQGFYHAIVLVVLLMVAFPHSPSSSPTTFLSAIFSTGLTCVKTMCIDPSLMEKCC